MLPLTTFRPLLITSLQRVFLENNSSVAVEVSSPPFVTFPLGKTLVTLARLTHFPPPHPSVLGQQACATQQTNRQYHLPRTNTASCPVFQQRVAPRPRPRSPRSMAGYFPDFPPPPVGFHSWFHARDVLCLFGSMPLLLHPIFTASVISITPARLRLTCAFLRTTAMAAQGSFWCRLRQAYTKFERGLLRNTGDPLALFRLLFLRVFGGGGGVISCRARHPRSHRMIMLNMLLSTGIFFHCPWVLSQALLRKASPPLLLTTICRIVLPFFVVS